MGGPLQGLTLSGGTVIQLKNCYSTIINKYEIPIMFNIFENPSHFSGNRKKSRIVHTSDEIRESFTLLTENRRKSKIVENSKARIPLNAIVGSAEINKAE